jgi:hypothetical protein
MDRLPQRPVSGAIGRDRVTANETLVPGSFSFASCLWDFRRTASVYVNGTRKSGEQESFAQVYYQRGS